MRRSRLALKMRAGIIAFAAGAVAFRNVVNPVVRRARRARAALTSLTSCPLSTRPSPSQVPAVALRNVRWSAADPVMFADVDGGDVEQAERVAERGAERAGGPRALRLAAARAARVLHRGEQRGANERDELARDLAKLLVLVVGAVGRIGVVGAGRAQRGLDGRGERRGDAVEAEAAHEREPRREREDGECRGGGEQLQGEPHLRGAA
jgi:hypothetical protein